MTSIGKIIIIEGLQGSGKTLFCKSLCQWNKDFVVLEEWVDPVFLAKYIANMKEMATEFQFKAQEETIKRLQLATTLAQEGKTVLLDRGVLGNRAFAEVQYEAGFISEHDILLYRDRCSFRSIISIETWFLSAPVETCLNRIKSRNRDGESAYQYDYLRKLDEMYRSLLSPDRVIDVVQNYELTETGHLPRDVCVAIEV